MNIFGTQHLALFMISGLLLNITPGQDTLVLVDGRRSSVHGPWSVTVEG